MPFYSSTGHILKHFSHPKWHYNSYLARLLTELKKIMYVTHFESKAHLRVCLYYIQKIGVKGKRRE